MVLEISSVIFSLYTSSICFCCLSSILLFRLSILVVETVSFRLFNTPLSRLKLTLLILINGFITVNIINNPITKLMCFLILLFGIIKSIKEIIENNITKSFNQEYIKLLIFIITPTSTLKGYYLYQQLLLSL